MLNEKNISLDLKIGKSLPIISGDFDRLSQVLNNLISNAIKYTKSGGRIKIKAYDKDNYLVVDVSDNGIGISPEDQLRLFDKFYRVESGLTQEVGGTGLGLTITKSIINKHGGDIWVKSSPGKGSTFSFNLPVSSVDLKAYKLAKTIFEKGHKRKILVVDDEMILI